MPNELKPCPCCGKENQIKVENGWESGKCVLCGFSCSVPTRRADNENER